MAYWSWINVKQWCGFIACGCRAIIVVIVKLESLSGYSYMFTEVALVANIYIVLPSECIGLIQLMYNIIMHNQLIINAK